MRVTAIAIGSAVTVGLSAVGLSAASANGMEGSAAVTLAQEEAAGAKKDPSRRVCRMIMPSGSRLGIRTCKSAEDWDREARQYQRDAEQQRQNHERVQPGSSTRAF